MRAVNLLPREQRSRSLRAKPSKKGVLGLVGIAAVAGVGYWGFSIHQQVVEEKSRLEQAVSEKGALQAQVGAYAGVQAQRAAQERRKGLVVGIAATRVNWERVMRDVATAMPRQTWLESLKAESPGAGGAPTTPAAAPAPATGGGQPAAAPLPAAAGGGSGEGLHLTGFAFSQRQVAVLLVRLASVPGLGEPRLTSSTAEERGNRQVYSFRVDIPIDQRAQDRSTLTSLAAGATSTATPTQP